MAAFPWKFAIFRGKTVFTVELSWFLVISRFNRLLDKFYNPGPWDQAIRFWYFIEIATASQKNYREVTYMYLYQITP